MIYLVGMMGCGKSTLGKAAADMLGLPFYDTDEMAARDMGMTVSEIFETLGEAEFRAAESRAIRALSRLSRGIVATGGGAVLRPENIRIMQNSGSVIWIHRDIEETVASLDPADRPLLMGNAENLRRIYLERLPLYRQAGEEFWGNANELAELILSKGSAGAQENTNI